MGILLLGKAIPREDGGMTGFGSGGLESRNPVRATSPRSVQGPKLKCLRW